MAANFWTSSHHNHWLLDKNRIQQAYAKERDTFTEAEIRKLKIYYAVFLQSLGRLLKLKQRLIATAIVYFKRFYIKNSFLSYDPRLVAPSCLYLASKVEECPIQAKQLHKQLKTPTSQSNSPHGALVSVYDPSYAYTLHDILEFEFFIIEEMNFYLIVYHPYRPLTLFLSDQSAPKEVRQLLKFAWYMTNDSYRTDVCLSYAPYMVALACIYMAAVLHGQSDAPPTSITPASASHKHDSTSTAFAQWWYDLNVDMAQIASICAEISWLYGATLRFKDMKELERDVEPIKAKIPRYDKQQHNTTTS